MTHSTKRARIDVDSYDRIAHLPDVPCYDEFRRNTSNKLGDAAAAVCSAISHYHQGDLTSFYRLINEAETLSRDASWYLYKSLVAPQHYDDDQETSITHLVLPADQRFPVYTSRLLMGAATVVCTALEFEREGNLDEYQRRLAKAERKAWAASDYLRRIGQQTFSPTRYRLPTEITLKVMEHLETRELLACQAVCRQWGDLLSKYPRLWLNEPVLRGTPRSIARQFRKIRKAQKKPFVWSRLSIEVDDTPRREGSQDECWPEEFMKRLPLGQLKHFKYDGCQSDRDGEVWQALRRCMNLTSLSFKTRNNSHFGWGHYLECHKEDAPFRQCELEELEIDVDLPIDLDSFNVIRLKKLILKSTSEPSDVRQMLFKAANTLEHLQIGATSWEGACAEYDCNYCEYENSESEDESINYDYPEEQRLSLRKLKIFHAIANSFSGNEEGDERINEARTSKVSYGINAPNLEELVYKGFRGWDRTLFDSCCRNVKTVYLEMAINNEEQMWEEMHRLKSCKTLTLDCTHASTLANNHLFTRFFTYRRPITPLTMLKSLQNLTIIEDELTSGNALIRFAQWKARSRGQKPLISLRIVGCRRVHTHQVEQLRSIVSNVEYTAWKRRFT